MTKPPLATTISSLLVASMIITPTLAFAAGGVQSAAEREISRRQEYENRGGQMIEQGDQMMKARDYEKATAYYKNACDLIPNAYLTQHSYARALQGFCNASCKLAEQRIAEGRYADAENTLRIVVSNQYAPRCREAVLILAHLEDPTYYNRTIGPQFRGNVEKVKQLFVEAQGYYDTGRFDPAFKRCEQILNIDKYNKAARGMEEKINRAKSDFYNTGYNEQRSRAIANTDLAWANPVRRFAIDPREGVIEQTIKDPGNIAKIQKKLERTIIPKLDFKEATIREAVDYLKRKSVELDPIDDPKTGINIVLKLEGGTNVTVPDAAGAPAPVSAIPGLDQAPVPAAAAPVALGNAADTRITVALSNTPQLGQARQRPSAWPLCFKTEWSTVSKMNQSLPFSRRGLIIVTFLFCRFCTFTNICTRAQQKSNLDSIMQTI